MLVANPTYRESRYEPAGPMPESSQAVAAALKGRRLPLASRVEISIIEEGQARWLAFLNRELDFLDILPVEFTEQALDARGKLLPELAKRGIVHDVLLRPNTWWFYFNMEDPVVGGYTPEKIALRRAIGMGYDNADGDPRAAERPRSAGATGSIPPDIAGYDPTLKTQAQLYDPALARALLDRFGYKDRDGDGYRETPDGKPLAIERWSTPNSAIAAERRAVEEEHGCDRHPARAEEGPRARAAEDGARRARSRCAATAGTPTIPDAENFMQLLYGGVGTGQQRALQPAGIQRAVRARAHAARFAGAHAALRPDDGARRSRMRRGA